MAFGRETVGVERGGHVSRARDPDIVVLVRWVRCLIHHEIVLNVENVLIESRVCVIVM